MSEDDKPKLNVLTFKSPENTDADINVDAVLDSAKGKLKAVLVAGWTQENSFYFAMSQGAVSDNLLLLETGKAMLIDFMLGGAEDE